MEESDISRSPKRRRVASYNKPTSTSMKTSKTISTRSRAVRSTSPDELAATNDDFGYSAANRRQSTIRRSSYGRTQSQSHSRSHSQSAADDSPDELDHTVHTFYRAEDRSRDLDLEGEGDDDDVDMLGYAIEEDEPEEYTEGHDGENGGMMEEDEEEELRRRIEREERMKERERTRWRKYRLRMALKGHTRGVAGVKFSPDGRMVASCSADATIRVWDAGTGKQLHVLEGHLAGISTLAWSPDSKVLASGSDDKSIWLWNAITGRPYPNQFLGHHNYIYSIAFSPKGNMIVSGSYDEAVFLWDVRGARVMRSLPAHSDPVGGVDFVRDGTLIVSCAGDGLIRIWDTLTGQCLRTLVHEDNAPVSSVRFSPNGKYVLAWTLDSCVRLWNYVDGRCIKTYQGHKNSKYSIGGSFGIYGDGSQCFVASGSEDGAVMMWDITSKKVLQRLDAHDGVVLGLDTMDREMATCGIDGTVKLWEIDRDDEGSDEYEDSTDEVELDRTNYGEAMKSEEIGEEDLS